RGTRGVQPEQPGGGGGGTEDRVHRGLVVPERVRAGEVVAVDPGEAVGHLVTQRQRGDQVGTGGSDGLGDGERGRYEGGADVPGLQADVVEIECVPGRTVHQRGQRR